MEVLFGWADARSRPDEKGKKERRKGGRQCKKRIQSIVEVVVSHPFNFET